jgi:hypothetical protein
VHWSNTVSISSCASYQYLIQLFPRSCYSSSISRHGCWLATAGPKFDPKSGYCGICQFSLSTSVSPANSHSIGHSVLVEYSRADTLDSTGPSSGLSMKRIQQ